eukprot:165153-Chlamydomonas_euryale.AAC.5
MQLEARDVSIGEYLYAYRPVALPLLDNEWDLRYFVLCGQVRVHLCSSCEVLHRAFLTCLCVCLHSSSGKARVCLQPFCWATRRLLAFSPCGERPGVCLPAALVVGDQALACLKAKACTRARHGRVAARSMEGSGCERLYGLQAVCDVAHGSGSLPACGFCNRTLATPKRGGVCAVVGSPSAGLCCPHAPF